MERVTLVLLLHLPCLKFPQVPWGVPKLANLMEEMTWFGSWHSRKTTGLSLLPEFHKSTGGGWDSETCAHKLPIFLVAKVISVGSPPTSSNNTITLLPFGCSHERGTWYLQDDQWFEFGTRISYHLPFFSWSFEHLQFLWWFSTIPQTFGMSISPFVIAATSASIIWSEVFGPESSDALSIDPSLAFPHTGEVDCYWITTSRSCKERLCTVQCNVLPLAKPIQEKQILLHNSLSFELYLGI